MRPDGRTRTQRRTAVRSTSALLVSLAMAVAALAVAGQAPARGGTLHTVTISDFAFSPATLTVQVGDTVTWTNLDPVQHTATSTSGAFDSGLLDPDASYSVTFTQAGTYAYLCTPHPSMTGQVVVQAATAAPSQPGGGGGTIPDVAMPASDRFGPMLAGGVTLLLLAGIPTFVIVRRRLTD